MTVFHFDLRHARAIDGLQVDVHGAAYALRPHTDETLAVARREHSVLAALHATPPSPQAAPAPVFTHYAEVDDTDLDTGAVRWIRVLRPAPEGVHLPEVVMLAQYLAPQRLRSVLLARRNREGREITRSGKLARLGVGPCEGEAALELRLHAETLITHHDTAVGLIAHHPDLATTEPHTAQVLRDDHIAPDKEIDPDQYNAMAELARTIADLGQGWSRRVPCQGVDGTPLTAGYSVDGIQAGDQLYTFDLHDRVLDKSRPVVAGARRTSSDDEWLRGKTWRSRPGTSVLVTDGQPLAAGRPATGTAAPRNPSYRWTVDEPTSHHGVNVGAPTVVEGGTFSIDASNSYLRTLYLGYELFDESGTSLGPVTKWGSVPAVDTILGIPVPAEPKEVSFALEKAASVKLYFGSLGTSDWNADVSTEGALLTALWEYGVPLVCLAAGKALTSTKLFNRIVNDRDLLAAALGVGLPLAGGTIAVGTAITRSSKFLTAAAGFVLGIVVQKGLEKLGEWLIEQVGEGALANAFGPVGWALKLVAAGMDFEQIAITTGEVLSSPACVTVKASRSLDVTLTLHPDPRHGEAGHPETAVWPAVATRYVATLQYRGGASRQLTGELPAVTSKDPLKLRFADVPAGGDLQIVVGVYSAGGWLAGSWQSDWTPSKPTGEAVLDLGDHQITENLVPLAPDTQYVYKEQLALSDGKPAWRADGTPPSATKADLDCQGVSGLCDIAGATFNNSAFQVGYAWRASGQELHPDHVDAPVSDDQLWAVQNVSVLADPDARRKTTTVGFTARPAIAYAPSPNAKVVDETNFVLDPRDGGMHLRQVRLDDGVRDFGFDQKDLPSWGRFPLENVDALAVHPSNAVIACSWQHHKLMLLSLPAEPATDDKAQEALLVSGQGIRQGLLKGPKALAVAPDGRILVLESLNNRIQAFDTKGNPVPSFTTSAAVCRVPTAQLAADLDDGRIPEALHAGLQEADATLLFPLDARFTTQLDSARFQPANDPLIDMLAANGIALAYDPDHMTDPAQSARITVVEAGRSWIISDPRGMAWQVLSGHDGLTVHHRLTSTAIHTERAGARWLVLDDDRGNAWKLISAADDTTQTEVYACTSSFPLRGDGANADGSLTYLDMAVESQGYTYVLSYTGAGSRPQDYLLDIYGPDGRFIVRTPDSTVTKAPQNIVAAKIAVDVWRNLYALGYAPLAETRHGPTFAHWTPTPPLFTLPLTAQPNYDDRNISAVRADFAAHSITLTNAAAVTVTVAGGAWQVQDGATIYHLYRSGDGLQVYAIPA
ncbi:hypothetical protein TPA0598_13_00520 [Streptomyces lydicamycinicus]|uniref:Uncharacterized protein n=1 Tax=Streptomyces lydicamycinicus TaxID=1546107 RepID=A0A0P4RHA1_9ACTN|nr:hypothetical protein [Streptomyces lydicamycinicus]GAO12868.1 hypothetical protein TPA0598_13_00520 [Streptomyces lydicamycinicus]